MLTLQQPPTHRDSFRTPQVSAPREENADLVPAAHVKNLLRELAIRMHSTRVVGWKDGAIAPKKG